MKRLKIGFAIALLHGSNCMRPYGGYFGEYAQVNRCWPTSPPSQVSPDPELAKLELLLGNWVSEVKAVINMRRIHGSSTLSFEWNDDHSYLVNRGHFQIGDVSGESLSFFYWDPVEKKLSFKGCSSLNDSYSGVLNIASDGKTLQIEYDGITSSGAKTHGLQTLIIVDANTIEGSTRESTNGQVTTSTIVSHRLKSDSAASRPDLSNTTLQSSSNCSLEPLRHHSIIRDSTLAVLDFDVGEQLGRDSGRAMADLCRDVLNRNHTFVLLDRERIAAVLGEQDFVAAISCDNSRCLVKYGKLLGAASIMHGRINKLGRSIVLTVAITDVNTSKQSSRSMTLSELEQAINAIPNIVCEVVSDATRRDNVGDNP